MTTKTQSSSQLTPTTGQRSSLADWMRRHSLLVYAVLAYGLSWSAALVPLLAIQFGLLPPDTPVVGVAAEVMVFGPAVAALIVLAATQGRAGLAPWLRSIVRWRVGIQWYFFVLLGVPLLMLLGESFIYGLLPFQSLAQQWQVIFTRFLPLVLLTAVTTGLGEEPGWRGFALPNLQAKHGPLLGTLLLGLLWALWHLPNLLLQPGGPTTFALWFVATMVNAFVLTWVYNGTRSSVLLVILLHAMQNSTSRLVANLVGVTDPIQFQNEYYIVSAITFGLLMAIVIVVTNGRLGYQPATTLPSQDTAGGSK